MKIVVRSLKDKEKDLNSSSSSSKKGLITEFNVVDLERDEIDRCCFPSLNYLCGKGCMISINSNIYIIGGIGLSRKFDPESHPDCLDLYRGGAMASLNTFTRNWSRVPLTLLGRTLPKCAAMGGKIYVFGERGEVGPEVYDPEVGNWRMMSTSLPSELEGCKVSGYVVLPDPANNRFLMLLSGPALYTSPALFAFYPALHGSDMWKCLAPGFVEWYHIAAVDENVLYIHNRKKYRTSILGAYDLERGTWLEVKWSSPFEHHVEKTVAHREFHALLTTGNRTLCLACWAYVNPLSVTNFPSKTRIIFLKFRADRCGSTITLTPLSSHSFDLPCTSGVEDFQPV